jgi:hypothetical protein
MFYDDFHLVPRDGSYRCPWALNIACLAADCGVELPFEASTSGAILIDSLLHTGLIEPFEDRYRARRPPPIRAE